MHDANKINKVLLNEKALSPWGHIADRASEKVICVDQPIIRTEGSDKLHSTQNTIEPVTSIASGIYKSVVNQIFWSETLAIHQGHRRKEDFRI